MAKLNKLATFAMVSSLLVASIQPSMAAIEIDESDFGPSYGRMVADTTVAKPVQLLAAVAGSVAYVVSAPFAMYGGNLDQTKQKLVQEPWDAMRRCVGCTVAEDKYQKYMQSQQASNTSFVVNEPSRITIKSDGNIVVDDYTGNLTN